LFAHGIPLLKISRLLLFLIVSFSLAAEVLGKSVAVYEYGTDQRWLRYEAKQRKHLRHGFHIFRARRQSQWATH
jgi:hypothetical protein